jgi:hypothetical protein
MLLITQYRKFKRNNEIIFSFRVPSDGGKKKYEAYIKYGFTHIAKDGIQLTRCIVCLKTMSNNAM